VAAGTYTGTVTTNWNNGTGNGGATIHNYTYNRITSYSYSKITSYSYNKITGYSYTAILSYTYARITGYNYNLVTGYTYNLFTGYGYSLITGYSYGNITSYTYQIITGTTVAPSSYSYTGVVSYTYARITGYTYQKAASYTYEAILSYFYQVIKDYTYNLITGYTYNQITDYSVIQTTAQTNMVVAHYDYVFDTGNYELDSLSGRVLTRGNAVVLVTDSVSFTGQDSIEIDFGATMKLYVSATSASIRGNGVLNYSGNANQFYYYGLPSNTSLAIGGNGSFTGVVYAPQADFTLGGGGNDDHDFIGASISKSVSMNGHFKFHYDENLSREGPARGFLITSWNEILQ
jgi:hypothetical protein